MIIETREDVVILEGSLDKNLWPTIQAAANLLLRAHGEGIIIDCAGLTACTPAGALTLRDAIDYIERYDARIVVCSLPENILATLRTIPGLRSKLPTTATVEEARASLSLPRNSAAPIGRRPLHDILVPIFAKVPSDHAIALACRIAKADGLKARIHLAYVLEIPRALPLTAPLPEEECLACDVLDAAEKLVKREGLAAAPKVCRGRDAGEEIVNQAHALNANMIVLSYSQDMDASDDLLKKVGRTVLDRSQCEVILNKVPAAVAVN